MTMLINAGAGDNFHSNPTIQIPPWDFPPEDPFSNNLSLSSTTLNGDHFSDDDSYNPFTIDAFSSSDHFRMFEFKIRKCARGRSHDWTECPYAHPGEKARRRDPIKVDYSGDPCPEFKKGVCKKGDGCEYAHGVFECWLHPSRYRTQPCKDGTHCRRRICFFAHTPEQLRLVRVDSVIESYDGSPSRLGFDSFGLSSGIYGSSPTSTLYSPSRSPPMSPVDSLSRNSVNELGSSFRNLQIGSPKLSMSPSSQMGYGFFSPRSTSTLRPGFMSMPSTPKQILDGSGLEVFDIWEPGCREEPVMERVESGRDLRARMYAKLSKENSLDRVDLLTQYTY